MTREQLLAYIQAHYNALATTAGLADKNDDATGYGPAIDDALRFLSVTEADLATAVLDQTQVGDGLALVKYTTLALLLDLLAVKMDLQLSSSGLNAKRSQIFTQAQKQFQTALADITRRGYGPQDFDYGQIQLDILEPMQASGGAWGAPLGWY